jgi:YegS/Rv2252/BmrU family lipid kinase
MKHLFIVNPVAGKGKTLPIITEINEAFKGINEEYIIEVTERPGHATEIVKRYVEIEDYRVYSVGGDGTLNEVLNGIVNSNSSLAIIPSGTGNDFIKSICKDLNMSNLLYRTINGKEEFIDLAKVNHRYFINISSVGFDAQVVYNTVKLKKSALVKGSLSYVLGVLLTLFSFKSFNINIKIDENEINADTTLIAIANGKYYGGGMMIAPMAKINDGILDICLIKKVNKIKLLALLPTLIKGTHEEIKEVSFHRGKRVSIVSKDDIALNIDGEVCKVKEVLFEIIHKGIEIVIPAT